MKVTQGVLNSCDVYGITFEDKYSDIKTFETISDFRSNYPKTSKTSSVYTNYKHNYNKVIYCELTNCNVENGKFIDTILEGLSGTTNYINDGYFSGCTIHGYTINGGYFYNCEITENNVWNKGIWDNENGYDFKTVWTDGVWNRGTFNSSYGWKGGTFNGGIFKSPAIWYDGIVNGGTFSGTTWHNGLVRYGEFIDCEWMNGVFNDGVFIEGVWNDGNFNGGEMFDSIINGGNFYNGVIDEGVVNSGTELKGGKWSNVIFNGGEVFNIEGYNLTILGGEYKSGTYKNSLFTKGDIYNGIFFNISGNTSDLTIHNGTFKDSVFNGIHVKNGNFTNCYSEYIKWDYGVYTDGEMYKSVWYDGYWNDSIFGADQNPISTKSNEIILGTLDCALTGNIECLCVITGYLECDV